ncbi:hypothetical protein ASD39_14215 [Sphingomonas sp. Root50]|nr:hypothetical protein ASD17_11020 [Sphingomonas sp. Root1294]KQY65294.1 hypothetical protein ASD39_14215 [Sphingomonas sp. Root50]
MCELLDHIMDVTQHFMLNSIIELDGGRAYGETYFIAYHRSRPTSDSAEAMLGLETLENLGGDRSRHYDYIIGGRYLDLFERRDDQWRIKTRRLVADWTKCGIATATTTGLVNKLRFRGSANRDDPSYEWLRGNPS